ncbi:MAG: DoxX family membrane protein [Hyphomicrobiales bacterium]|nr:DoxX family membrane protein [Hyphomicrobiales bacterium]
MTFTDIVSWICQLYLAFFFARSAYRKVKNFERVSTEFRDWGYPLPEFVTGFLVCVWIVCSVTILIPSLAGITSVVLLVFMMIASATLLVHGEIRRLIEPAIPILLLLVIIMLRHAQIADIVI